LHAQIIAAETQPVEWSASGRIRASRGLQHGCTTTLGKGSILLKKLLAVMTRC
jgi:hypothetical protein